MLLQSKDGVMLPMQVAFGDIKIAYATAEVSKVDPDEIEFRLTQSQDIMAFETELPILPSEDYTVEEKDGVKLVLSRKHAKVDERLIVRFGQL